ncbi:MAG: ATP phosphoribosyltransferase [Dehalococcoidales bacterium]
MYTGLKIKIALPKGRLLDETARLLDVAGWDLSGYHSSAPLYHLTSPRFPNMLAKIFHEKDIPVQVAVGNYDLGICGLDWAEELLVRYRSTELVKVRDLGYGRGYLCAVTSPALGGMTLEDMVATRGEVRIVSEYPNLAEAFALKARLKRFRIFPVCGAAEVYPPESADLVLIRDEPGRFAEAGLVPVSRLLGFGACLIANRSSWENKDLSEILATLGEATAVGLDNGDPEVVSVGVSDLPAQPAIEIVTETSEDIIRLALPDGHQQKPTIALLEKAGVALGDYRLNGSAQRPRIGLPGTSVKVIRPQDMPLQVANGNFDLAITGRDWLRDHLSQFPGSPVTELLNLGFGWVKLVAVVSKQLAVDDISRLASLSSERSLPLRIASEYTNIADKYARDNHLGLYRIIPTWGATEAFLPDDADMLIENTETGGTIARHNLKIIDTLFESTACLIGNTGRISSPAVAPGIERIIGILRRGLEAS